MTPLTTAFLAAARSIGPELPLFLRHSVLAPVVLAAFSVSSKSAQVVFRNDEVLLTVVKWIDGAFVVFVLLWLSYQVGVSLWNARIRIKKQPSRRSSRASAVKTPMVVVNHVPMKSVHAPASQPEPPQSPVAAQSQQGIAIGA